MKINSETVLTVLDFWGGVIGAIAIWIWMNYMVIDWKNIVLLNIDIFCTVDLIFSGLRRLLKILREDKENDNT